MIVSKEIMEGLGIKEYIRRELPRKDQETALDFIHYLEERGLTFYKDNCDCWKDKIYYWVKHGEVFVCFIAINDPDEKENNWTVWSDTVDSECLNNHLIDCKLKEAAFKHINYCGHCNSCGGGKTKILFGKEFHSVCGCTFRIDNPLSTDLPFLKAIIEIQILGSHYGTSV